MTFKKGDKKPENSGRKKGTPNKISLGVEQKLAEKGVDCIDEMLKVADETKDLNLRFAVFKELAQFVFPKRKTVELRGEVELPKIRIKGL